MTLVCYDHKVPCDCNKVATDILGKIEFYVDLENTRFKIYSKSEIVVEVLFLWKKLDTIKTIKSKINLNTQLHLLQNDQNADTTLLHSHDEIGYQPFCDIR